MKPTYTVDVICCYCKAKYGEKPGFSTPDPTHGICPPCFESGVMEVTGGRKVLVPDESK